jgi:hypothetical protein
LAITMSRYIPTPSWVSIPNKRRSSAGSTARARASRRRTVPVCRVPTTPTDMGGFGRSRGNHLRRKKSLNSNEVTDVLSPREVATGIWLFVLLLFFLGFAPLRRPTLDERSAP